MSADENKAGAESEKDIRHAQKMKKNQGGAR